MSAAVNPSQGRVKYSVPRVKHTANGSACVEGRTCTSARVRNSLLRRLQATTSRFEYNFFACVCLFVCLFTVGCRCCFCCFVVVSDRSCYAVLSSRNWNVENENTRRYSQSLSTKIVSKCSVVRHVDGEIGSIPQGCMCHYCVSNSE